MKTFLVLLVSILFFVTCNSNGQANSDYEVYWTPNPTVDSVAAWAVYLESHNNASGFFITDGMAYSTQMDQFYLGDVQNIGQTSEATYTINLPNDGSWKVAGVIAYTSQGIKSVVGASNKYKVDKVPGKPLNVGIRKK